MERKKGMFNINIFNININAQDLPTHVKKFARALPRSPSLLKCRISSFWKDWWRWPRIRPIIKVCDVSRLQRTEDGTYTDYWVNVKLLINNRDHYPCNVEIASTKMGVEQGKGRGKRTLLLRAEASEDVSRPVQLKPKGTEGDSKSLNVKFVAHHHNGVSENTPDPDVNHPFKFYDWTASCKGFGAYKKLPSQGDKRVREIKTKDMIYS